MKWRKSLAALLSACLLLSCTSCSFVENYFGVTQEDQDYQEYRESQVSALSSALEPGNMKKLGEPITCNWSTWQDDGTTLKNTIEITVTGAQIFEKFEDAGIPVEETNAGSLNKVLNTDKYTLPETPFVLVDVTIKKTEGATERKAMEDGLLCTMFSLHSRQQLEWCKEHERDVVMREPEYFSGHEEQNSEGKGYGYFWLDLGEKQNYQIGFFLKDPEESIGRDAFPEEYVYSADEGLLMGIGIYSTLYYVDLEIE